jgi:hypothetical protein
MRGSTPVTLNMCTLSWLKWCVTANLYDTTTLLHWGKLGTAGDPQTAVTSLPLGVREELWQWVEALLASERFDPAAAADFRDAVASKIPKP